MIGFMGWNLELVDQRLTWTPRDMHDNTRTGLVRSRDSFDLTDCAVWLEVPRVMPTDLQGEVNVALVLGDVNVALMRASRGNLLLLTTTESGTEDSSVPYDSEAHRWWRFREAAGVLFLETSPNGVAWTVQVQREHKADAMNAALSINVIDSSLSGVFEAPQLDNVNVAP